MESLSLHCGGVKSRSADSRKPRFCTIGGARVVDAPRGQSLRCRTLRELRRFAVRTALGDGPNGKMDGLAFGRGAATTSMSEMAVTPPGEPSRGDRSPDRVSMWRYASLGTEFAGGIVGFVLLGWYIDRTYGSSPWALLTCALLGCVGGFYHLIRQGYELQHLAEKRRAANDDSADREHDDDEPRN